MDGICCSCGAVGEVHKHHLVPQVLGGAGLPTVRLCVPCHGKVHGVAWSTGHSELTRKGLQRAKARGIVLGNRTNLEAAQASGAQSNHNGAEAFAANVFPAISQIQAAGITTARAIASALNARGVRTDRGGKWHGVTVQRLLARTSETKASPCP